MSTTKKRRVTIAILAAALVGTIAVGSSLAFLTDSATKTNSINVETDLGVDVEEPDWDPDDEPEKILPGDTYYKNPKITTMNNVYARFKVEYIDQESGVVITDAARIAKIKQVIKNDPTKETITAGTSYTVADIADVPMTNTTDFSDAVAGDNNGTEYYYYKNSEGGYILNGPASDGTAAKTNPLFTAIVVPTDWTNEDVTLLGKFDIKVTAEAIQADNQAEADVTFADFDAYKEWFNSNYTTA